MTAFAILAMFDIINAPQETRIMPDFNNLTLLRATPSAVSKVWGGRSAPPPQVSKGIGGLSVRTSTLT